MDAPTIAQLTTVGGLTIATSVIVELFWRTLGAAPATVTRFGPISAAVVGIGLGLIAGIALSQGRLDLFQSGLNGLFGGLSAMGVQNLVSSKAGVGG